MTEQVSITLPTEKVKAVTKSPRRLVIYSAPKQGKTTVAAGLDNSLILDLEKGTDFMDAVKITVTNYQHLIDICKEIDKKGKPYKYLILDTATTLEDLVIPYALKLYQDTPMGKSYTGNILALPNGAGYLYLRNAYMTILNRVARSCERLILLGHLKDKLIEKNGKEVSSREIDLTGKLKNIVCADADAIGLLYREGNKCILTFETNDEVSCGARPIHLRNKKFVISEQDPATGETKTYWDKIYID